MRNRCECRCSKGGELDHKKKSRSRDPKMRERSGDYTHGHASSHPGQKVSLHVGTQLLRGGGGVYTVTCILKPFPLSKS